MLEFHLHLEYRHGNPGEPIGIETKLGWVLFGAKGHHKHAFINKLSASPTKTLTNLVEKFWEVESYSTESPLDPKLLSKDEKRTLEILEQTATKKHGKYEVGIRWKDNNPSLPNNRALAIARMINMERKFKRDPKFHEMYTATINYYIKQGHGIKVTSEKSERPSSIINYLPHHRVSNINKPERVRVVFDAGAKFENTCLREVRYGIITDIQQMFHQVLTNHDDQQALRFLWRDNPNQAFEDYAMTVHVFGMADSPYCANWALKRTALDQKESVSENAIDAVLHKFYMDDSLDSFNNVTTAVSTILPVSSLLKNGGFHLPKWTSNSNDMLNNLPKDDISPKNTNLDLANLPIERTLGIVWDPKSDQITVQSLSKEFEDTKRGLLSCASSIFDPLGIVNPALLEAKLLIQELWRRILEWDDKLPIDLLERWIKWKSSLDELDTRQIPRWYGFIQANLNLQLHVFCDASCKAYGCVCYFRSEDKEATKCSFICCKSRLASISKNALTILSLELQAAVLAARMKVAIFNSVTVKINKVLMWSDSKTVLQYIRNVKYNIYLMHRVSEIKKNTDVSSWNYIPGVLNVADDATRITKFENLNEHCRWFNGPEFLVNDKSELPKETSDKSVENKSTSINQVDVSPKRKSFNNLNYYSNFYKLVCHVANLLKLKHHWTKRHRNQPSNVNFNIFTVKETEESINVTVCESQKEYYPQEFNSLSITELVPKDSKLLSLHPLLIDNMIRVGG